MPASVRLGAAGRLAQMVRASDLHSEGQEFESPTAHPARLSTMRKRTVWRSPKSITACPVCGEAVQGTEAKPRTFCSAACSNRGRVRAREHPSKSCLTCGALLANPMSSYCSGRCHHEFIYLTETRPRIESGGCSTNSTLRAYLLRERGSACAVCGGGAVWQGESLTLHVDHVDGDSDCNVPSNLRLLCPNCHSQTKTYTGRNTKNTRRNRYLRRYKSERSQK